MATVKQGPTRYRPMAHPVVLKYLSYSTTLAEHAAHRLRSSPTFIAYVHRLHSSPTFIAYGGARASAGLRHVCSCLFS